MEDGEKKDRSLKFDSEQLFIEGVLLKLLCELEEINRWLEGVITKRLAL